MATSPSALAHPSRAADSSTSPDLQHPTPDLQSLQGAYIGNIERLEEHAERMSEKGSDLGEEIRKLQLEQKLSDSRRSSLLSASVAEEPIRHVDTRSRGASTSSFTNSIVDLNGAARWGGYSPGGYLASPTGSLHSSTSQPTALQRQRSNSKASRLDQIMRVDEEEETMEKIEEHPGSPPLQRHDSESQYSASHREQSPPLTRPRSVSSFTRQYNEMAQELKQELRNSVILADTYEQQQTEPGASYYEHPDLPDRPPTAASTDTTHKLRTLWQDFDGTHCPDTVPEEEPLPSQGNGSRDSSMLKSAPSPPPQGAPPPDNNMVYYPAPVPRMLNLPQRLSKVPNANVQARRRTQLLESMQSENRKSAPWLSEMGASPTSPKTNRKSKNLANMPPQLRASAYFDAPAPAQEFEVKGESAQDTLNNILEASAHAPVSAFTDHPYAGHVGDEIYGQEKRKHKRTGSKANELDKLESRKSRSSLNLLDTRRNSSGDALNKLKKHNSSADLNLLTVRATESRMSLGDELENHDPDARGPDPEDEHAVHSVDGDHEHAVDDEDGEEGEEEPEEQFFVAPTTLLAELQMRKAQQKTRNLTAATAFPNGMHATLLELDAVAEIEKKKRLKKKVNLAWEAQAPADEDADSDDDVPLGMLYPGREGLVNKRHGAPAKDDWDRPLGLMAQREIENAEPLNQRRTRLFGNNRNTKLMDPAKRNTTFTELNGPSQQHLAVPTSTTPQPESEEDEGETLAQRIRRMKDQQALDEAVVDVRKSTVSNDFATELMSQFGFGEEEKPKTAASPANDGEEETLGQRRARLQAEALARGDANPHGTRPPLRASMSMADVLGAHPIDPNNSARKVSDEQLLSSLPQGSLLHQNAVKQERRRVSRMDMNQRSSTYNLEQPLLGEGVGRASEDQPLGAKIQAYKDRMAGAGVATPMTAPALSGIPMMNPSMSSVNLLGAGGQRNSYFPQAPPQQPMMGMNGYGMMPQQMMGMQMNMMGVPMNGMQGMGYPQVGPMGMPGMRQSSMINLPSMSMGGMNMGVMQPGMGMPPNMGTIMMEPPMDPRQRDAIDRWRSAVMH
ncbi:uncharacterized protein N0V89_001169 [Didymosphaeria variabile]|uniref:Uncharacterized protein n=1 Tax=Didymosphaeria variabile TaxID=1932322 RepID=A0A9W9CFM7_9PLEO|nr:uncharacterized protein N0V89_001169 [Didymosphaeria variabile]KAJ4360603.1 hypothetical protein N0V89_001169 [Didymosphaeria variabile]